MFITDRIETFVENDGTWHFAKLIKGECTFFITVSDVEKAHKFSKSVKEGFYDPSKDKHLHSLSNPHELYAAMVAKSKKTNPTVFLDFHVEHGNFNIIK